MTRATGHAISLVVVAACFVGTAACKSERTEMVVRVWGSPGVVAQAQAVDVVLRAGEGADPARFTETGREHFDLHVDGTALPIDVAIVPQDGDASRQFELVATVTGLDGAPLTGARVISGFVEGKTKQIDLWLADGCLGVTCPAGQSCFGDATCADAHVDSATLLDFVPRPEQVPFDAGPDANLFDAGPPMEREGGIARPTCTSAADCDDDNPCTDDACETEHCVHRPNTASCDDGAACTHDDACRDGVCEGVAGCTVGLCDRSSGECVCSPGAPGCGV